MERFLFIFIHAGIPLLVLTALLWIRPKARLALLGNTAFYLLLLTFLYFWGQWPLAISLYFKYLVLGIIVVCIWKFFRRWPRLKSWWPQGILRWIRTGAVLLLAGLLVYPVYQVLSGRTYDGEPELLNFPLRGGTYYVALGGSNRALNNHYGTATASQWYALDLNKLGKWGMATSSLWATDNEAHAIFGEPVYAPCKGIILEMKSGVPDNLRASMDVSREDGTGNYVVLDCDELLVALVHLQQNSVAVAPGQRVLTGDLLGRVGNSGFSQEPHLHLQAARYQADSTLMGVPIRFGAGAPVRNDIIRN